MPLLMVLYVVLFIVAGSHLVRYRGSNGWLLAIVFLPFVGSLSYIVMVMKPSWLVAPGQRPAVVIERGPYSREYKDPVKQVLDEATRRLDEVCKKSRGGPGLAMSAPWTRNLEEGDTSSDLDLSILRRRPRRAGSET